MTAASHIRDRGMRIAYLTLKALPEPGGIEKYTEEVGTRLASRGHQINVYVMGGGLDDRSTYRGMHIRPVPAIRGRATEKLSATATATVAQLLARDADLFHYHAFGPSLFCLAPRVLGARVVVQGHGLEWKRSKWGVGGRLFLRLTEIPSVLGPHALTVVSRVQQKYLADRYGREAEYIPTGVNPPVTLPPERIRALGLSAGNYILFASRLVREKGAHYLIPAFRQAGPALSHLKLVIAGDARYQEAYKAELLALADGDPRILFPGMVTGPLFHELMSNAALFVLPSEIEGLPTVLLEAMSYGNCCLASDIPENVEALAGLGYTFRSRDVEALTAALRHLATDTAARLWPTREAKNHVARNHSWDAIALSLEALYARTLARR